MIHSIDLELPAFERGFHLITDIIELNLKKLPETGLINIFLQHTSAALTINENYDPSVRKDMNTISNKLISENESYYTHTLEGSDDMPAHFKTSLMGVSLTIPIRKGRLALGMWQGIYLCEFRNHGGRRKLLITVYS